ncbi:MAG: error-prone DNA polymerase, partial [Actinomycetota bacterium]|nr:error-prone DNA polymerase [Actinomycetota bacterium]
VKGVREEEMEALVAERERAGPYKGIAELASRSGVGLPSLERLAWAGALDGISADSEDDRRQALWRVGVTGAGRIAGSGTQLALPMEPPKPPELEPLGEWGRLIADYRSTGMSVEKHPLKLLRPGLDPKLVRSSDLSRLDDGSAIEIAGMVTARQRPETANGITFMLLEDERGSVNLVVPPPVYERRRPLVRTAPLLRARGRLERRDGIVNVVVSDLAPLERAETPTQAPKPRQAREHAIAELRAVTPAGHAFGRRGR